MSTVIYPSPIFGPIHSRRLGISLGINLMPADGKVCTFDCIYCECGFNKDRIPHRKRPTRQEVAFHLEKKLKQMNQENVLPDAFTNKQDVFNALMLVDNNILKIDTVSNDYITLVDRPVSPFYDVNRIIGQLKAFKGHVIIQSMFMKGTNEAGVSVDNTGEEYVAPWLEAIKDIAPQEVMVYTIDRETPDHNLLKATREELDTIKQRVEALGIPCTASY